MSARTRTTQLVLTVSALTSLALLGGVAPAAADDSTAGHPLAVLAPLTGAFAEDAEETPLDAMLNAVVPQEAANVIGPALDQADTVLGQGAQEETHSEELILECRPDTGTCDEVSGDPEHQSPPVPRG